MYKNAIIVILIAIIIGCIKQCSDIDKDAKKNRENNAAKEYELNVRIDKQGKTITEQQQLIVTTKKERDELIIKVERLTKITEQLRAKTSTKIIRDTVKIDSAVYISTDKGFALLLPAHFSKLDKWYGYTGTIGLDSNLIMDSLWINNSPTITFGMEKWNIKNPFKKRVPLVTYQDDNPHTTVREMRNVKYDKPLPKFSLGVQGGYGLTLNGFTPYIGLGIGYSLIRF